jgi:hypothetical protein
VTPAPEFGLVGCTDWVSCGFELVVCAIATAGSIAITSATTSFGIAISIHTLLVAETTQHCREGLTVRPLCSFQLEPKFWNYAWSGRPRRRSIDTALITRRKRGELVV